jgi:hypothetical protein
MRILIAVSCFALFGCSALAQGNQASPQIDRRQPSDSEHSTGRTEVPMGDGQKQPQGPTGPINTGSGGAPAESPQGQTPPGMQAAPEGSSKTIVDEKK